MNLDVAWTPGLRHPTIKNIFAAETESSWYPDPGYTWVDARMSLDVVWTPGMPHPKYPHVLAHKDEGMWAPAPGYRFVDSKADLKVVEAGPGGK